MAGIAIIYCKRIKDHSCIAWARRYKAMHEKDAEFARHKEIELVAMTDRLRGLSRLDRPARQAPH
jgi:hypothetical protein